jgi:hypothetical protein
LGGGALRAAAMPASILVRTSSTNIESLRRTSRSDYP